MVSVVKADFMINNDQASVPCDIIATLPHVLGMSLT